MRRRRPCASSWTSSRPDRRWSGYSPDLSVALAHREMRPRERGRLTPSTARRTVSATSRRGRGAVPWPSRPGDRAPDSGGSGPPASSCPVAPIPRDPPLMHDVSPMHWRQHQLKIKRLLTVGMAAALVLSLAGTASAASPKGKSDSKGHKSDNIPGKMAKKQDVMKQKAREMVFKGKATSKGKNQVVKVAKGQYVELAFEGEDQILTFLGQFGPTPASHLHGTVTFNHAGTAGPLHNQIPEPNRNGVDNTTIWTKDFSQSYYAEPALQQEPEPIHGELVSGAVVRPLQRQRRTSAPGCRSRTTRLPTEATTAATSSAPATSDASWSTSRPRGARSRPPRARPRRTSTPSSRSSMSGIATTMTAMAISTSRTATSTTSSRSTPVKARRPVAALRPRMPSGAIAPTRMPGSRLRSAPTSTALTCRSAASRSRAAASGSATTPSSRRTVASASSRTSSAMTLACPTSTTPAATPAARRTAPRGGRPGRRARTAR